MRIWSIALFAAALSIGSAALAQDEPGQDSTPEKPQADEPKTDEDRGTRRRDDTRRQRRQGRGFMNRMAIPVDEMKEPLGLSDEQVTQLKEINKGLREQVAKFFEKMQSGEMPDRQEMRETMRKGGEEVTGKLREILSEDQYKKYEKLREERQTRMRRRWGQGRNSEALIKRLRDDALKTLELDEEASALVSPLLDAVLETRKQLIADKNRRRDEFKKKVRESNDPEELTALLKEYRAAQEDDKEQLVVAQDKLRELLTLQQEAKLVGLQILD